MLAFEVMVENTIVVIVVIGRTHLSMPVDNSLVAVLRGVARNVVPSVVVPSRCKSLRAARGDADKMLIALRILCLHPQVEKLGNYVLHDDFVRCAHVLVVSMLVRLLAGLGY